MGKVIMEKMAGDRRCLEDIRMNVFKRMLPYILVILIAFYLLPLLMRDTGTAMAVLLLFIPLVCFVCSLVYGVMESFHWQYALMTAILFLPSIFLYYNSSASVYSVGYGVLALIGNLLGALFKRRK